MKYEIGCQVVHKSQGICKIIELTSMYGNEYYKLIPNNSNTTIYVPTNNTECISNIMSVKEADELLKYMKTIDDSCLDNSKQRRDTYTKKLNSGNKKDLAYLSKSLYFLKQERTSKNLRFSDLDNQILTKASDMLFEELSITYNIDKNNVLDFILNRMENL